MDKKRIKIILVSFLLVVIGVIIWNIVNRPATFQAQRIPLNEPVARYNDDAVVFSNGRNFVVYNVYDGSVKPLGKEDKLPSELRSLSVSDDGRYILFVAQKQFYDDVLGKELIKNNINTSQPTWWIYDIEKDAYKNLPVGIITAAFNNSSGATTVMAFVDSGIEGVVRYDGNLDTFKLPLLEKIKSVKIQYIVDIKNSNGDTLFTQNNKQEIKMINKNDGRVTQSFNSIGLFDSSKSQPYFVHKEIDEDGGSTLKLVNAESKKTNILGEGYGYHELGASWSFDGNKVFYPISDDRIESYSVVDKKKDKFGVKGLTEGDDGFSVENVIGGNLFLLKANEGVYLASNKALSVPKVPSNYKKKTSSNSLIVFSPESNAFLVSVETDKPVTQQQREEAYKKIESDGFDPNFWAIHFSSAM